MWIKEFTDMRIRFFVILFIFSAALILFFGMKDYITQTILNVSLDQGAFPLMSEEQSRLFMTNIKRFDFYAVSQWYGKNFGQFIPFIAIILAFPVFSREVEKKTIYFLITRKKRSSIFFIKFFCGAFFNALIIFLMVTIPYLLSLFTDYPMRTDIFLNYLLAQVSGGSFWYSITILFSILFNDQIKTALASFGVFIAVSVLPLLEVMRFLNIYSYILNPLLHTRLYGLVLLTVSAMLCLGGNYIFKKKDY